MKPRTKLQKRVFELSQSLKPIKKSEIHYAEHNFVPKIALKKYSSVYCTSCGHKHKDEVKHRKKIICPSCNSKLRFIDSTTHQNNEFTAKLIVVEDFQVVRLLLTQTYYHLKDNKYYNNFSTEVIQYWISPNGEITIMGIDMNFMAGYYREAPFKFGSDMSIKTNNRYYYYPSHYLPKKQIKKDIRRLGIKSSFHGFSPYYVIQNLIRDNRLETLWKYKRYNLFEQLSGEYNSRHLDKHWNSVKLALRHNYKPKDTVMWLDYLNMLHDLGRDVRSPKYIFPLELKKEHDRVLRKINERDRKRKLKEELEQISIDNRRYIEQMSKYFDFKIQSDNIEITVLKSVFDFKDEGNELNHCVSEASYYRNFNNLILSAKVNGKRTETIELVLHNLKIRQCQGYKNNNSVHHNRILELTEKNVHKLIPIRDNLSKAS